MSDMTTLQITSLVLHKHHNFPLRLHWTLLLLLQALRKSLCCSCHVNKQYCFRFRIFLGNVRWRPVVPSSVHFLLSMVHLNPFPFYFHYFHQICSDLSIPPPSFLSRSTIHHVLVTKWIFINFHSSFLSCQVLTRTILFSFSFGLLFCVLDIIWTRWQKLL